MSGRRALILAVVAMLSGSSCGGAPGEGHARTAWARRAAGWGPRRAPPTSGGVVPASPPTASASETVPWILSVASAAPVASGAPGEAGGRDPAAPAAGAAGAAGAAVEAERWCASEFDALADGEVCAFVPPREMSGPRTLVVFLHGIVVPGSGWQWMQQRAAARVARAQNFAVLMPRGRRGAGPKGMHDVWAWPGAASPEVEAEIVATWQRARVELEGRDGRPFERVWVFGFSSGAYYATSLALRGRLAGPEPLHVDGFAAFAGGGGKSRAIEQSARRAKVRTPLFVAWGGKDRSRDDPKSLAAMLRRVGWPSKGELSPKAGHAMTDAQVASAVRFLSSQRSGAKRRTAGR